MNSQSKTYEESLSGIQKICSRQEKSPAEILSLLKRWGIDTEEAEEILQKLRDGKFIDESRYALAFVRDKIKFEHWGFVKIKIAIQKKGIPTIVFDEAVKQIDAEAYRDMIKNELEKKRKFLKGNASDCWQKLARFGYSRGYETEIMYDMLEEICKKGRR